MTSKATLVRQVSWRLLLPQIGDTQKAKVSQPDLDKAVSVAADVDCQWDILLVNTYKIEALQILDFSSVRLPVEWFTDWLKVLKGNTFEERYE